MVRVSLEGRPRLRSIGNNLLLQHRNKVHFYFLLSQIYVNFLLQIADIAISLYFMQFYANIEILK